MPNYVLLLKYHSEGLKAAHAQPESLLHVQTELERWEVKVLESFHLLGEWDQCTIIEAPDNFKAYRATLSQELSTTAETEILPAIDLTLFQRLLSQEIRTEGPHPWQVKWWARAVRFCMYWYSYTRWERRYFTDITVTGKEKFNQIKGPCLVIANHASHLDQFALMKAIPMRIKLNMYFGAAADRWFLKGRKELQLKPWYASLVSGSYPIKRGGGGRTLDYPKWLVDHGANLMLFPEGTRTRGKHLSSFKHGASVLALEKNLPVVPVYLAGLGKLRPPGVREVTPGPVGAHVLDPIHFPAGTTVPEATRRLYEAMKAVHEHVVANGIDSAPEAIRRLA